MARALRALRVSCDFISLFFKSSLVYRANFWLGLSYTLIYLLAQVALWRALLGDGEVEGTTLEEMVTYVILVRFVGAFAGSSAEGEIEHRLRSGDIAIDMARPLSYRMQLLYRNIASSLSAIVLEGAPVLLASSLFFGINPPASAGHFAVFLVMLVGGLGISFYIDYLIGLVAFYVLRAKSLSWFVGSIERFLSGQIIPLWFYPDWLRVMAEASPFKLIFYTPVAFYLGRAPLDQAATALTFMFGWLGALVLIESLLWRTTVRRLVVQGG